MTKYVIKRKPQNNYRVVIQVFENNELVTSAGAEAKADKFSEALPTISNQVTDQWTMIQQWAHVANEIKEN